MSYPKFPPRVAIILIAIILDLMLLACGDTIGTSTSVSTLTTTIVPTTLAITTSVAATPTLQATSTPILITTTLEATSTPIPATPTPVPVNPTSISGFKGIKEITLNSVAKTTMLQELSRSYPTVKGLTFSMYISDYDQDATVDSITAGLTEVGFKAIGNNKPSREETKYGGYYTKPGAQDIYTNVVLITSNNVSPLMDGTTSDIIKQLEGKKSYILLINAPQFIKDFSGGTYYLTTLAPPDTGFQKFNSLHALEAFKAAGVEIGETYPLTNQDIGLGPRVIVEGTRFFIPSLGKNNGGRIFSYASQADLNATKNYYLNAVKAGGATRIWLFTKDNILVQINGGLPDAKAKQYEAAMNKIPSIVLPTATPIIPTAIPKPTTPPFIGFYVDITGTNGIRFTGSCLVVDSKGSSSSQDAAGTVPIKIQLKPGNIASCALQKQGTAGQLTVKLMYNDTIIADGDTSAEYGVVTVSGSH